MFERFTEQARRVLVLATREARNAGHPSVDSGDLLVALAEEVAGVASRALTEAGAEHEKVMAANRDLPIRPVAALDEALACDGKTALQAVAEQAAAWYRSEVGTAHLLLGILDQDGCRAVDLLAALSIDRRALVATVVRMDDDGARDGAAGRSDGRTAPSRVLSTLLVEWEPALDESALAPPAPPRPRVDAADDAADLARQWALADWLVRVVTPTWLDAAGVADQAAALRSVEPLGDRATAEAAGAALDAAASELAEQVPAAVPPALRPAVAEELARCRSAGGERAASAAVAADLADGVTDAAAEGVSRAMGDLVMRRAEESSLGLWARAFSNARKEVDGSARGSAGRRPSAPRTSGGQGSRRDAMRAVRMAAGPAALPLTILEAGVRSARERRARDRLDQAAARAAVVACCRQL